ncbi:MAG: DUF4276 family protein [Holophagales bacterium]|jgi:hypothetical protein|nr:DUF4276 family protein [Holophagales bacterium]
MMRLLMLLEGQTEEAFVKATLGPHFNAWLNKLESLGQGAQ